MKLKQQTVLITGGSSGIGFQLAKVLHAKGNTVIICGRSEEKLNAAKQQLNGLVTFQCDISVHEDRVKMMQWIWQHYPLCNVLVNNAAVVSKTDFLTDTEMIGKAENEIATNLTAPIALSKLFLNQIKQSKQAAIINITSGLIYAPRAVYPVYNATKAALHSFTQVLRHQSAGTPLKVIEVMMPAVDTPWHNGDPPKIAISVEKAVKEMMEGVEQGKNEIRVGGVKILYALSRIAPGFAFRKINNL